MKSVHQNSSLACAFSAIFLDDVTDSFSKPVKVIPNVDCAMDKTSLTWFFLTWRNVKGFSVPRVMVVNSLALSTWKDSSSHNFVWAKLFMPLNVMSVYMCWRCSFTCSHLISRNAGIICFYIVFLIYVMIAHVQFWTTLSPLMFMAEVFDQTVEQ